MAAQPFNDGSDDIPGGTVEPVERVVVVGAGIAGLTAANALAHAGVSCIVVEARGRLGGRLHTVDLDGSPVDLGGSWIHHPTGNPVRTFTDQMGIPCTAGDPLPQLSAHDLLESRRLEPHELAMYLEMEFETFPAALDELRAELEPTATAAEAIETFVARARLSDAGARRARQTLRAEIEADAAAMSEDQSLRWLWHEDEYDGDFFGDLPVDGYRSVVAALASSLDIRLGFDVAEVRLDSRSAVVTSSRGKVVEGSHVIVAVPLGVLKRRAPTFSPSLPSKCVAAIERLGFGQYEKVALSFENAFWRSAGLSHLIAYPRDAGESATWIFDLDAFGAGPTLVCHVFQSSTARVLGRSRGEAIGWVTGMLSDAFGGEIPTPTAAIATSWAHDPYTRGAYTHIAPGGDPSDLDQLGEPVAGRLLFAGEHTHSARTGYTDGAMSSGIREAKRLLRRPAIELGQIKDE